MTNATYQTSNQNNIDVSLYRFKWGNTIWRYTSGVKAKTVQEVVTIGDPPEDVTYLPIPCSDSGMVQGGSSSNDLTMTAPYSIPLARLFESTPPALPIWLTVRRIQVNDPDQEALIYWVGTVTNVKPQEGDGTVKIIGKTILASMKRSGVRLGWTRGCPHMVYDSECKADPEDFRVDAEITAMTGNSITVDNVDGHDAGYFDGGYIEWIANADGTIDRRSIESSETDDTLVLLGTTFRLEEGMAIKLYPGCALDTETCDVKFDNLPNYGGCEQMTGKNPFDGNAII